PGSHRVQIRPYRILQLSQDAQGVLHRASGAQAWPGLAGGYVMLGLVRWWQLTRKAGIVRALDKAFEYFYNKDINDFRCTGGAMDCVSVDREGIHPFLTTAMVLYRETGETKYLEYARKASWYFVSWLYIHNPIYGPESDFSRYGIHPAGATIVGVEHAALDEYACILIPEFLQLARADGNPMWRDIAALVWCHSTEGFADETHRIFHNLERPIGSKNEAIFPSLWSKYTLDRSRMRGSINDHLIGWPGTYRISAIYDLSVEDLLWLEEISRPQ
ncbi:MAG: hypothetical protein IJU13_09205, partial [Bacteroidales bacterium]|nr:hypothetical protein [Bacteroidales bacterium]